MLQYLSGLKNLVKSSLVNLKASLSILTWLYTLASAQPPVTLVYHELFSHNIFLAGWTTSTSK